MLDSKLKFFIIWLISTIVLFSFVFLIGMIVYATKSNKSDELRKEHIKWVCIAGAVIAPLASLFVSYRIITSEKEKQVYRENFLKSEEANKF